MKRNTLEYEQALGSMTRIPRKRASAGPEPLPYGLLSAELGRWGHLARRSRSHAPAMTPSCGHVNSRI